MRVKATSRPSGEMAGFTSRTAPDVRRLGAAAGPCHRPQVRDVAATTDLPQAVREVFAVGGQAE